jgi:hypothetical protein
MTITTGFALMEGSFVRPGPDVARGVQGVEKPDRDVSGDEFEAYRLEGRGEVVAAVQVQAADPLADGGGGGRRHRAAGGHQAQGLLVAPEGG